MTEYFKIGKFVSSFGLLGELVLKHHLGKKTTLKGVTALFVEDNKDSFLPWFIESARIKAPDQTYLKLEGVNSKEKSLTLVQKEVWLPEVDFKKIVATSSPINFLGYSIVDGETVVGIIKEIIEQPHQLLCKVDVNDNEALIPLHEETIKKIDQKKRQIIVDLPEGLLEIYQ